MARRILIIGMGSPVGDDRVGLVAAERLREARGLVPPLAVEAVERPGVRLIELWTPVDDVMLLDAVHTGAPPGSVLRVPEERIDSTRFPWSSHGFGPAEAVALARALGRLPRRLVLFGVEIAAPPRGLELSREISEALPGLIQRVIDEARSWSHGRAHAG